MPSPESMPRDDHNARLISRVHPADWQDPEPKQRYALAVTDGQGDGLLKIHTKKGCDPVLGATIVADHAGEVIKRTAAESQRARLTPLVNRLLHLFLRRRRR